MSKQFNKLGILWIAVPFIILIIIAILWGGVKLWNEFGWYFPFGLSVLLLLIFIGRMGWIRRNTISSIPSIGLKDVLIFLVIVFVILLIVFKSITLYDWWNKPKMSSASEQTTPCSTCTAPDNRPKIRSNQMQLLHARVEYSWDRKCKTIYYFEPKEVGSTALTYRYDRHPERYLTGDMVRTSKGPNFFPQEGADPMADGIYTVTVDKDVWVYIRTD